MDAVLAEVTRGDLVERVHRGSVAVVRADRGLVAVAGDAGAEMYLRSCAKPFHAVPLVTTGAADALGLSTEELAVACASHNGTERPRAVVLGLLAKAGAAESDLRCGWAPPRDERERARVTLGLREPTLAQCACSGEHAGMVAACRHAGWPVETYLEPGHPLQEEILAVLTAASGVPACALARATDGCGLPTYATTLRAIATAYAVLADPNDARWQGDAAQRLALLRLRQAMVAHPELVSGEGETDTEIMRATEGRVVAMLGAEGLLCLAVPEHGLGVAIRDASGSSRALGAAALAVLATLGLEWEPVLDDLRERLCPPVRSFAGEVVGEIRPAVRLVRRAHLAMLATPGPDGDAR